MPGGDSGTGLLALLQRLVPAQVREGGDEPVALTRNRRDETRMTVVVLELDPEAADVAVHDVALGNEVSAPDRVQDLLPGDDPSTAAREQVEEALLDAAQVDDRAAGAHLPVQDVDLDFTELDRWHHGAIGPEGAARDDDRPRDQFLG